MPPLLPVLFKLFLHFLPYFFFLPIMAHANDLLPFGCLRSAGQPICCTGRNMSCKSTEKPRRPIFSFALRDDQVREVRFGKHCVGRIVLPDLVSLNGRGLELVRQLGHNEQHFRLYRGIRRKKREEKEEEEEGNWEEETVIQFGWEQDDPNQIVEDKWEWQDESPIIRYSLLSRQLPLRIVKRRLKGRPGPLLPQGRQTGAGQWAAGEPWRMHFLAESRADCFCDQLCTPYGDCCANYPQVCPPVDCHVGEWSRWSECVADDGKCGVGLKERKRMVTRERQNAGAECPELEQRVGCFRQCGAVDQRSEADEPRVIPDVTTVALLLDYQFNESRQISPSFFFKRKAKGEIIAHGYPEDRLGIGHRREEYVKYCVHYRIEWLNRECIEAPWRSKLARGQIICAECQPEAQFHRPRPRCASDLEDGHSGFWKLIGPKYCYGIWRRLSSHYSSPDCVCGTHFPRLSPFLLV